MTSWTGYLRPDGSKGIRDWILVVHTVECARFTAEKIASGEENVCCIGYEPCNDNDYAIRLMLALSRHPNAGGALFVGLGCEYTQPRRLAEATAASGRPADWYFIQDVGGTTTAVAEGKRAGAKVIAVDVDDSKLEMMRSIGAAFTVNSKKENLQERVMEITGGHYPGGGARGHRFDGDRCPGGGLCRPG
ncbi:UxaA family hydrolase [Aminivibrio sp.]|jgi:altronate dehydratase|uniref:UxaA family hydrolase n=1 Tax=Aminivibrio sp. TaxID=1872489 RepID=UPI001A36991B|nr:UxaA family hydrolase [Aminivibrio sp.]MBL3539188.1 UxaA family hydrolase [Aminivibrio sp.]MDK2959780.1 altronate dehydratase large subunit [Synergistaceae bacterium]